MKIRCRLRGHRWFAVVAFMNFNGYYYHRTCERCFITQEGGSLQSLLKKEA